MRGADSYSECLFTTVKLEGFAPASHPLRPSRPWVNDARNKMDAKFSVMYKAVLKGGRPSIAPEKLMRAMLIRVSRDKASAFFTHLQKEAFTDLQHVDFHRYFVLAPYLLTLGATLSG